MSDIWLAVICAIVSSILTTLVILAVNRFCILLSDAKEYRKDKLKYNDSYSSFIKDFKTRKDESTLERIEGKLCNINTILSNLQDKIEEDWTK